MSGLGVAGASGGSIHWREGRTLRCEVRTVPERLEGATEARR